MKSKITVFFILALLLVGVSQAWALLLTGPAIIPAPPSVIDDPPGATNTSQQAFNERRGVFLTSALAVDGGTIGPGIYVDSHMIFLNTIGTTPTSDPNVVWTFDGIVLGVMSAEDGSLELASSPLLGAPGTIYPITGPLPNRGLEINDGYSVLGNSVTVSMQVTEPGDWIRVVTLSTVPEPGTWLLLSLGLAGMLGYGYRRRQK